MAPARPTSAAPRPPAQREHPVLVDADQRHRAGVLARGFQRAAEVGAVDEEIQRAERRDRYRRADQLRLRQEDAAERDGLSAKPGMGNAAIVRREEELRHAAHDDGEPEGGEDLHHAGIGFRSHRKAHDQEIDHRPEHEQRSGNQRRRQQGIDGEEGEQEERRIHRDHQEFAVREIHDVHQPEDQREPHGNQPVEQPHQQAAGQTLDNGLGCHGPRPRCRPLTSSARRLRRRRLAAGRR